jgi:hypothetical protein
MNDAVSFAPQWRDLKRRCLLFWVCVAAVPLTLLAVNYVFAPHEFVVFILIAVPLFVLLVAAGAHKASFRCPRCSELFFESDFESPFDIPIAYQNTFSRKCMNCGLPRGAEPGPIL